MEHFNKLLTFIFITSLKLQAQALINPHQGSLELDFTSDLNLRLPFALHYSSRSLYEGSFGRGWCSSLDYKITSMGKSQFELSHCENKLTVTAKEFKKQEDLLFWTTPEGVQVGFVAKTGNLHTLRNKITQKLEPITNYQQQIKIQFGLLESIQTKDLQLHFTYDSFDNLESVSANQKRIAYFKYDNQADLLISANLTTGCDLNLTYKLLRAIDVETKVVRTCNKIKYIDIYLFKHQRFASGEIYLAENTHSSRKESL